MVNVSMFIETKFKVCAFVFPYFAFLIDLLILFRNKMHMPTLENVYQTLSKQRDILNRQKLKINMMKLKLGLRDDHTKKSLQRSDM